MNQAHTNQLIGDFKLINPILNRSPFHIIYLAQNQGTTPRSLSFLKVPQDNEHHTEACKLIELEAKLLTQNGENFFTLPWKLHHIANKPVIEFELIDGLPFSEWLKLSRSNEIPLGVNGCLVVIRKILNAISQIPVATLDKKQCQPFVVHGSGMDSLILTKNGNIRSMGFADLIVDSKRPDIWGWSPLSAPEFIIEGRPIDQRADIYAAGALLFNLMTLRPIISAKKLSSHIIQRIFRNVHPLPSDVEKSLKCFDDVLRQSLHWSPDKRFQSPHEFLAALQDIVPTDASVNDQNSLRTSFESIVKSRQDAKDISKNNSVLGEMLTKID